MHPYLNLYPAYGAIGIPAMIFQVNYQNQALITQQGCTNVSLQVNEIFQNKRNASTQDSVKLQQKEIEFSKKLKQKEKLIQIFEIKEKNAKYQLNQKYGRNICSNILHSIIRFTLFQKKIYADFIQKIIKFYKMEITISQFYTKLKLKQKSFREYVSISRIKQFYSGHGNRSKQGLKKHQQFCKILRIVSKKFINQTHILAAFHSSKSKRESRSFFIREARKYYLMILGVYGEHEHKLINKNNLGIFGIDFNRFRLFQFDIKMILPTNINNNNKMSILLTYIFFEITSTANVIITEMQNHHPVEEGKVSRSFYHPIIQTEMMIISQALCIIPYLIFKKINNNPLQPPNHIKQKPYFAICLLPLCLDLTETYLIAVSLNFLSGSIYSIMSSLTIVSTAVFSRLILKYQLKKYQIIGSLITIVGVLMAGIGQNFQNRSGQSQNQLIIGISLLLAAFIIQGLQITLVERIYKKYNIEPLQFVGWQGMAGTVLWSGLVVLLQYLQCPYSQRSCVIDFDGESHIEHAGVFFSQLAKDWFLILTTILLILVTARFNYDMGTVISKVNALTYCILNIFSNIFIWIVGLIFTIAGQNSIQQFQMESLDLLVLLIKLLGFLVSALGMLIYFQIIFIQTLKEDDDNQIQKKLFDKLQD